MLAFGMGLLAFGSALSTYIGLMMTARIAWIDAALAVVAMLALMYASAVLSAPVTPTATIVALEAGLAALAVIVREVARRRWAGSTGCSAAPTLKYEQQPEVPAMRQTFHPAIFLGAVILLCTAWLWARPPVSVVEPIARGGLRPALVEPASIELDVAILERYAGTYEGRGGFTVDLMLKNGKLFAQSAGTMPTIPFELRAISETEFFLKGPGGGAPIGVDIEFDVADDGIVRGFAAKTEYGLIEVKRVR